MNWNDVLVFAVIFSVVLNFGTLFVSQDVSDRDPHIEVVGYRVVGRGWPVPWLEFTYAGADVSVPVIGINYSFLLVNYVIWLVLGFFLGTIALCIQEGFYG